jgi:methylglutaconyl-CoA hydratase
MSRHSAAGASPPGPSRTDSGGDGFIGVLKRLSTADKPTVCALNGPARAGGVGLMAACDVVVAPLSATFAFSEVRLGVAPAVIAVPVMKRTPAVAARQLFLTGRTFDAAHAARIGLVDVAVADHEVGATVSELVSDLLLGGPEALAVTKRLVAEIPGLDEDEALSRMRAVSAERFASGEAAEGIAAWREKRLPSWAAG